MLATGSDIITLRRVTRVHYSLRVDRDDLLEYLIEAGVDEDELTDLTNEQLADKLLDPDADYADEVADRLDDHSSEDDSGSDPWERDK